MVGASESRIPVSIRRVLHHVPVEIRRAVVPPYWTTLAEFPLDLVHCPVRGGLRFAVGRLLGFAAAAGPPLADQRDRLARPHRDPGSPCATATVRRHRMLRGSLCSLRSRCRLLCGRLFHRLLAVDRHQHLPLTSGHLQRLWSASSYPPGCSGRELAALLRSRVRAVEPARSISYCRVLRQRRLSEKGPRSRWVRSGCAGVAGPWRPNGVMEQEHCRGDQWL
jgi:hypothetical protein